MVRLTLLGGPLSGEVVEFDGPAPSFYCPTVRYEKLLYRRDTRGGCYRFVEIRRLPRYA